MPLSGWMLAVFVHFSMLRWTARVCACVCVYPPIIRLSGFSHVTKSSYTHPTYQCRTCSQPSPFSKFTVSSLATCWYIPARGLLHVCVEWERERGRGRETCMAAN